MSNTALNSIDGYRIVDLVEHNLNKTIIKLLGNIPTKICSKCAEELPNTDDYFRKQKHGLRADCRKCGRIRGKEWHNTHIKEERINRRIRDLIKTHGITDEEYNKMFENQYGLCAICGKPETMVDKKTGIIYKLAVDHNHKTGKIRGLLCARRDWSLGKFYIDEKGPEILLKIVKYLEI